MPSAVKDSMIKELKREFEASPYAFISSFDGLAVADLSDYRRSLEKFARRSIVVKHTLAKKVLTGMKVGEAEKFLKGSVIVTLGDKEPQAISKAIVEFSKINKKLVPNGVVFENKVYDQEFVRQLAVLPGRKELLTQVVVRVKSPLSGLVLTLNQLVRGVVVALNEIKKQKEGASVPATV